MGTLICNEYENTCIFRVCTILTNKQINTPSQSLKLQSLKETDMESPKFTVISFSVWCVGCRRFEDEVILSSLVMKKLCLFS